MKVKLRMTQVFRVERNIVMEVDAPDAPDAVERFYDGEIDTPNFNDPRWRTRWDLENEDVEPANS